MLLETITFEKAATMAMPVAKKIFNDNILPIIKTQFSTYFKSKSAEKKFETASIKYLARISGQCSTINTIAFQNAPKKLCDLYIPLTIESEDLSDTVVVNDQSNIFANSRHILINDTAGMGKSTLSKKVVSNIIAQGECVPVFIELRQIEDREIEQQIYALFGFPADLDSSFLKKLPLVYVFDGLDEVPGDKKKSLVNHLKSFIEIASDAKILITSRQETFLSEFYSFSRYSIKPLVEKESFALLRRYDPEGEISRKLISGINNQGQGLKEFLSTPLYVSLLYCSYRHKTIIPRKKDLFYSQVYDALFESHDLSKEVGFVRPKFSNLDSAEFHSVLRRLGFWCMKNNGTIEFLKDELEIVVSELLSKMTGIKTTSPAFVRDLTSTVPLFVKEGPSIRWAHKSLMEYFAAMFICNDTKKKQEDILLHYYNNDAAATHQNILELCSDIDFTSFRSSIVRQVLLEFLAYCAMPFAPAKNRRIPRAQIDERVSICFNGVFSFRVIDISNGVGNVWGQSKKLKFSAKTAATGSYLHEIVYHMPGSNIGIQFASIHPRSRRMMPIIQRKMPELFLLRANEKIDRASIMNRLSLSRMEFKEFCILDDDPKNKVNGSSNFELITNIVSMSEIGAYDRSAVASALAAIEADRSNGVDDLLSSVI